MVYKAIIIIFSIMTVLATSNIYPTHAQKLPKDVFIDQENVLIEKSMTGCTIAQLFPTINATVTIACQKDIQYFNDVLCPNQEYGPYIAACKYGTIQNFVETYNHDGNLGE